MFTGIIEAVGIVVEKNRHLVVRAPGLRVREGESVSVNGCCLTHVGGEDLTFALSEETLGCTNLGGLKVGDKVNLETAVKAGAPMGGHFVLGHVDAVGEFIGKEGEEYRFMVPNEGGRYLVNKGSIAVNGVSLTTILREGEENTFSVALIPYTLEKTNLGELAPGDKVNLEYDILAKIVEKLLKR
ncbi:MAG TPA: riboflavin synthase [Fimbriimonadales bacterium]|nr:riboflavin synthase [Fimbriimonadales bacterium]